MEIKIGNFYLAGKTRKEHPAGFEIRTAPAIQTAGALRGRYVAHYDRGNKETVISFGVTREHGTAEDAEIYLLEHESQFDSRGLVTLTAKAGNKTLTRWMANAVVSVVARSHIGLATRHQYEIRGGAILSEKPTA